MNSNVQELHPHGFRSMDVNGNSMDILFRDQEWVVARVHQGSNGAGGYRAVDLLMLSEASQLAVAPAGGTPTEAFDSISTHSPHASFSPSRHPLQSAMKNLMGSGQVSMSQDFLGSMVPSAAKAVATLPGTTPFGVGHAIEPMSSQRRGDQLEGSPHALDQRVASKIKQR